MGGYPGHLRWLVDKLNLYIGFIRSGQIGEYPEYSGRSVRIVIHFNGPPPVAARVLLLRKRKHLAEKSILFAVTTGDDIREVVDLSRWEDEAGQV